MAPHKSRNIHRNKVLCLKQEQKEKEDPVGRLGLCLVLLSGERNGLPKDCLTSPVTCRFLLKLHHFAQCQPFHHSVPGRTRAFLSHPNIWAILGMKSKCEHEIHVLFLFVPVSMEIRSIRSPGKSVIGNYELLDVATGNQMWVFWKSKCTASNPKIHVFFLYNRHSKSGISHWLTCNSVNSV